MTSFLLSADNYFVWAERRKHATKVITYLMYAIQYIYLGVETLSIMIFLCWTVFCFTCTKSKKIQLTATFIEVQNDIYMLTTPNTCYIISLKSHWQEVINSEWKSYRFLDGLKPRFFLSSLKQIKVAKERFLSINGNNISFKLSESWSFEGTKSQVPN